MLDVIRTGEKLAEQHSRSPVAGYGMADQKVMKVSGKNLGITHRTMTEELSK
jgi:hypothetical protein